MASDIIFPGHLPLTEIHSSAAADDDGGGEEADDEKSYKTSPYAADDEDDDDGGGGDHGSAKTRGSRRTASLPGPPRRPWEPWRKHSSEIELRIGLGRRRRRWNRERKLDRAWEMRKSRAGFPDSDGGGEGGECLVLVRPRGSSGRRICMDMDEVKACRDLGLQIPRDFTVEIPGGISGNSSGADSPISGTREDAKEIKAKLKMWAHAVAFASSAARSGR